MGLPRPVDSLPDHGFTTGALAIGIAAQLGWPRADVRAVGVTGLLCDAGMGLVPHPVRQAGRPLTEIEINAMRRHPEYGVALLRNVRGVPEAAVLSVYQHHERCDGSGYPAGIKAERMHDYARVVAVAEAFAGMTAPRAHRPPLTPHAAMSELAHLAAAGVFDASAVRALLDVLGLYPAGSFVKLSSGHVAVVGAAARPGEADRPTVHVVQPQGSTSPYGRAIDLAMVEPKKLRVVEAVRAPDGVGMERAMDGAPLPGH
jgi:HD-GYP domain-containing protein (c-di-GMP phosphodiesterase class II)